VDLAALRPGAHLPAAANVAEADLEGRVEAGIGAEVALAER
jgi:hypothetical protein